MDEENKTKILLTFKDEATGKFVKAQQSQINALKKMGVQFEKTGKSYKIATDKMQAASEKAAISQYKMRNSTKVLGTALAKLQLTVSRVRNILLLYFFAYRPLANIMKSVTSAAIDQEKAERVLGAAVLATRKITAEQKDALIAQAGAMQNLTGASDNETIKAQAFLVQHRLTNEQIKKATPLLIDMTMALRASGRENQTVADTAKVLGNAFSGRLTTLRSYGIHLSDAAMKTKDFDLILRDIEGSVGGMGKALSYTYSGTMTKFSEAWGDLTEKIGDSVIKSDMFKASISVLTDSFVGATDSLTAFNQDTAHMNEAWFKTISLIIGGIENIKTLGMWLRLSSIGWKELGQSAKLAGISVKNFFTAGLDSTKQKKAMSDYKLEMISLTNESEKLQQKLAMNDGSANVDATMAKISARAAEFAKHSEQTESALKSIVESTDKEVGKVDLWNTKFEQVGATMKSSIVDGSLALIERDMTKISDIVDNFGRTVLKTVIEGMVEWATQTLLIKTITESMKSVSGGGSIWSSILGIGGSIIGGVAGIGGGGTAVTAASSFGDVGLSSANMASTASSLGVLGYHTGGIVKDTGTVKSFHAGGRPGEVMARMLPDEGVVNPMAMKGLGVDGLNRLNRGEGMGGGTTINNYNIYAIDTESFRDRMEKNSDIAVSATENGFRNNGSIRKTAQGVL